METVNRNELIIVESPDYCSDEFNFPLIQNGINFIAISPLRFSMHFISVSQKLLTSIKISCFIGIYCLILFSNLCFAQSDSLSVYDLNLSQLSKLKITSASKITQNISEIPSTVFVITAEEIKERGYFTLEEALSDLPGFQFRNILGINSYVFQRGIPSQNNLTLVLIDGIQVNELNSGGFYAGAQYNLFNVERIEIIYGPSSVAYGTNAMSGVINIITKKPVKNSTELKALAGTFNTYEGDAKYSNVNEKQRFGVLVSGMFKMSDKANLKGREGDNNWTHLMDNFENDYAVDLKIQYKDFVFGTNYLYKSTSTATSIKSVGSDFRDYGTSWNIRFINNSLKFNKNLTEKLNYAAVLYNRNATVLGNTVYYVVDTAQIGYFRPNNLIGFENILNYDFNRFFSLTGGMSFEFERLSENNTFSYSDSPLVKPPTPEKPTMVDNTLISLFIEPRFTIFNNLYLSGGARFDQSSIYDQVLTPRAGLSYIFRRQLLRLSYAEAFRAPKPWDYTDGLGNKSLLPETMKSTEAAASFSIKDNYKIDLIGYKNRLIHAIIKEEVEGGYKWINSGEITTTGMDFYLRYISKKFKSSVNYTLTISENESGELVPEISKHSGNANVTYTLDKNFVFNVRANYIGKRENPKMIETTNSRFLDSYLIFHGAISFLQYKGFDAQLMLKNIFNKEYYHTSNREPDRYRQPQRTIMLSIGYKMN